MPSTFWMNYALALAVIAAVLAAMFAIARTIGRRRAFPRAAGRFVTILESTMVSPQTSVHVVKAGRRYLLIGVGAAGLATLVELTAEDVLDA